MKKVMLAMSGGVDSSAALILLIKEYEVKGVTLSLFDSGFTYEGVKTCCSLTDAEDARAVASRFDVPHYVYNFKERFQKDVIDRFINSYLAGETPNPCIDCNKYIKFEALLERAIALGCDLMATGHYARTEFDNISKRYLLKKALSGNEPNKKDQTYVLYNLTQEQLSRVIFPLGNLSKDEVRKIASENNLVNSEKPDSQDICFVPDGDYAGFITHFTGKTPESGDITDKNGQILGKHSGIINYTVGQRKGLRISAEKPLYVIGKSVSENKIIAGTNDELFSDTLIARCLNWISIPELTGEMRVKAKTRYSQPEQPCMILPLKDGKVKVKFDSPQRAITPGQSVVFYDDDIVVGGGTITNEEE